MTTQHTEHRLANGTITVQNIATGEHRTFKVRTQPEDADFAPGKRCIALLTGTDNESNYTGFGFVGDTGWVSVYKRKRGEPNLPSVWEKYAFMLEVLVSRVRRDGLAGIERGAYDVQESRSCIKCNRKLTDPVSIRLGIGPVCRGDQ